MIPAGCALMATMSRRPILVALATLLVATTAPALAQVPPVLWGGAIGRLQTDGNLCTFFIVSRDELSRGRDDYGPGWQYFIVSSGHCHSGEMRAKIGPYEYPVSSYGYASIRYGVDLMVGGFYSRQEFRVLEIDDRLPAPGERVRFAGFPHGVYRTTIVTVVAAGRNELGRPSVVLDVALSPGASGSPILSLSSEKVVGVVNLRSISPTSYSCRFVACTSIAPSYAVPIGELRAFLQLP